MGAPSCSLTSKSSYPQKVNVLARESMAVTSPSQPLLPARNAMGANTATVSLGMTLLLEAALERQKQECCRSPHP